MPRPRKKVMVAMVLALAVITTSAIFAIKRREKVSYVAPEVESLSVVNKGAFAGSADGDADNLKDWEEDLWKTDRRNPDSDGDGTTDGEEITLGRDPTVRGPKDTLAPPGEKLTTTEARDLSVTERLARETFLSATAEDGSKPKLNPENIEAIVGAEQKKLTAPLYTLANLSIGEDTRTVAARAYGNVLGEIFLKYPMEVGAEILILDDMVKTKADRTAELLKLARAYETLASEIRKITVPKDIAPTHLMLANSLSSMAKITEHFTLAARDPLGAFSALGPYTQTQAEYANAAQSILTYFRKKGVIYKSGEPGYSLTNPSSAP